MVDKAVARSIDVFENWDAERASAVIVDDEAINDARWGVEEEVILLIARQAPMASDLRELISIIHISTELERIGDYAKVVARTVIDLETQPQISAMGSVLRLGGLGRQQLAQCMEAFLEQDAAMARRVAKADDRMDRLWTGIYGQILEETRINPDLVSESAGLIWIAHNFERMGDRITNICERIMYTATGEFEENVHLESPQTD